MPAPETEALIHEVEKHPCIWDSTDPEYGHKTPREDAWSIICENLIDQWKGRTLQDKTVAVAEMKRKWANVRDYYRKGFEQGDNGTKRKYIYFNILSFLSQTGQKNSVEEDLELLNDETMIMSDETGEEIKYEYDSVPIEEEEDVSDDDPLQAVQAASRAYSQNQQSSKPKTYKAYTERASTSKEGSQKRHLSTLEESLTDLLKKRSRMDEDSDLNFFKGLLPDIKSLDDAQKLELKLGFLKLLKKITYPDSSKADTE